MKIVYILKKGFQYYPPCLAQLLYLDDLGVELEVYHGKNSNAINNILDARGIRHYELKSDRENTNRLGSIVTMAKYMREMVRILRGIDKKTLLWFGNCESFMTITKYLQERKIVLSILELDDYDSIYGRNIRKIINQAEAVICCEKHRAAIMQVYYGLQNRPYIMPNKPYELTLTEQKNCELPAELQSKINIFKDKLVVLYQGMITRDRPLDKIASALKKINNGQVYFIIMGKANDEFVKEIKAIYENVEFLGYIPSPQHLEVTKIAKIGIANYDNSCLNNLFCAPNKIYEYAKFGLPMITSSNIGLIETVGQAGAAECVDFNDVNAIAEGISKILINQKVYSDNAVKFYESTNNIEEMKKIVARVCSE